MHGKHAESPISVLTIMGKSTRGYLVRLDASFRAMLAVYLNYYSGLAFSLQSNSKIFIAEMIIGALYGIICILYKITLFYRILSCAYALTLLVTVIANA